MSFTYSAGTTTPTWAGLVEIGSDLRINDGSFRTQALPGLFDMAPTDAAVSRLPSDHGGTAGTPFYLPREFAIQGFIEAAQVDDLFAGEEYLRARFALPSSNALATVSFQRRGWSEKRQVQARVSGPVLFAEPDIEGRRLPRREFSVPMIAPDALIYSTSVHTWNLEYSATLHGISNAGNMPTWLQVTFNGPVVNPSMVWSNGTVTRKITWTGSIGSGASIIVNTNPTNGLTCVDNTGGNQYGYLTQFDLYTIPNGATTNFHAEASAGSYGSNVAVVTFRDAWA